MSQATQRKCAQQPPVALARPMAASSGRCEAHGAPPRPPSQPAGPTGPLGSRPTHLAPWRATQAPTSRPIPPLAGSAGLVSGGSSGDIWVPCNHARTRGGYGRPPMHRGVPWGHWGGLGRVGLAHRAPCGLNPWDPSGFLPLGGIFHSRDCPYAKATRLHTQMRWQFHNTTKTPQILMPVSARDFRFEI